MHSINDVLVVGAGPVGLTMAIQLIGCGARVRLVEQKSVRSIHSKALAIFPRRLEELHFLGLADAFLAAGNRLHRFVAHAQGEAVASVGVEDLAPPYPSPFRFRKAKPNASSRSI